jgi:hypothetical protein
VKTPRRRIFAIATSMLLGFALPAEPVLAKVSSKSTVKTAAAMTSSPVSVKVTEAAPTLAGRMAAVKTSKSINYYPSLAGWSKMWSSWNPSRVDADLTKAAALGATNVRAIIFPNTFGYPYPKPTYVAMLDTFVDLAQAHGMTVRFTLFDWWDNYPDIAGSTSWATTMLTPYKNDNRVISVELQNEFNPSDAKAVAWAKKMVPFMRASFPTMPVTFSVDGDIGATGMGQIKNALVASPVDYYDFHFYGNSERAHAMIRRAQATVAPAPVVIGEAGLNTLQNTEGEQAAFLARVYQAAALAGVQSVSPWTLTDFAPGAIPDSAVSRLVAQYSYGLYRTDGTAKPAAAVIKAAWTGTPMPSTLLDPSFEAAAGQTSWRAYLPELGLGVKTQSAARTGKWSVSFSNTGKSAAGTPSYRVAPLNPVWGTQKWHGEVWARGNAATGTNQLSLSWFDINDKWLGGVSSAALPTGTTNWTKLSVDGVSPVGAASMQIHLKSGENTGTVWFDDALVSAS